MTPRGRGARLRAVLHDQADGRGHRPGAGDGLRHRHAGRRDVMIDSEPGLGHDDPRRPPGDDRAEVRTRRAKAADGPLGRRTARRSCSSRTRRSCASRRGGCSRGTATPCWPRPTPTRRSRSSHEHPADRSAAHRRRHAGTLGQGAVARGPRCGRRQGAVHERLQPGRHRPPRGARGGRSLIEKPFSPRTCCARSEAVHETSSGGHDDKVLRRRRRRGIPSQHGPRRQSTATRAWRRRAAPARAVSTRNDVAAVLCDIRMPGGRASSCSAAHRRLP